MITRISVNNKIPLFELEDQKGDLFKVSDFIGRKNLIIYFYPKDYTPGCTSEAKAFRDWYDDFFDLDCEVVGVSADKCATHKKFASKFQLPFILLSDHENVVRKQFGVPSIMLGLLPGRFTYIVNKQGLVHKVIGSKCRPDQHAQEALKAIKELQ